MGHNYDWPLGNGLSSLINNEWFPVEETNINAKLPDINITPLNLIQVVNGIFYEGLKDKHNKE